MRYILLMYLDMAMRSVSKTERAKWGEMIETYITSRKQLRAVVSLVDIRHDPSKEDIQMYEFF